MQLVRGFFFHSQHFAPRKHKNKYITKGNNIVLIWSLHILFQRQFYKCFWIIDL